MNYWYFSITIYSELDEVEYVEKGIVIAENQDEVEQKLARFYNGDIIKKMELQWLTNEEVCLLPSELNICPDF